jgi:cytochrome b pre-mRNA-processing protein 3
MNFLQKILRFLPFVGSSEQQILAHNVYVSLVEDARNPETFISCKINDTVDGRFDVIVLHLSLLLRRINEAKENATENATEEDVVGLTMLSEELIGVYNTDMDRNLREIGVGDMSVGKHVKKMAKAFYGRLLAYDEALSQWSENKDQTLMQEALKRNIYRGQVGEDALQAMLEYVDGYRKHLNSISVESLLSGVLPKKNKAQAGE